MNHSTAPDYDHVLKFKSCVSWVKSYRYIGRIGHGYHYEIETEDNNPMNAVFCRAVDFWDAVNSTPTPSEEIGSDSFWIIVEDYLPEIEIDKFVFVNKKPIAVFFMNSTSSIHHVRLIRNLLDGVIQDKLQEMCEG